MVRESKNNLSMQPRLVMDVNFHRDSDAMDNHAIRHHNQKNSVEDDVTAMIALRRFAKHCRDVEFLDLEVSVPAQWCLKSLQSSMRELRIAAGYVMRSIP